MERFENQRWAAQDVAKLIAIFESERRFFDELVTTLPVPLAVINAAGAIVSANPAFFAAFAVSRDNIEATSLSDLFPGLEWSEALTPYKPTSLDSDRHELKFTPVPRWDRGETEWSVVFLQRSEPSQIPVAPAPAVPEAELSANTAAVESAQRLAGRVTHETNNLIMIASGYGHEILAQLPPESPLRADVSTLLEATGRIEAMAAQLSEYSRPGRVELAVHPLRDLLPATGYRLTAPDTGVAVEAGRVALEKVFAALATAGSGTLELETNLTEREAVITVKGFGMSAELLRQQFEALSKAARGGETGARERALAGPYMIQAGVRWRITDAGALEMYLRRAGSAPAAAARAVLVVDDQAEIRAIVRRILEARGFQVAEAGTGEEAISVLDRRTEPFQLLVTDMRMPGMTGRDLADRVRFRHPSTRVLFISGFTDDPGVHSGIMPEGAMFLPKPFHPEQLVEAVTKLLA